MLSCFKTNTPKHFFEAESIQDIRIVYNQYQDTVLLNQDQKLYLISQLNSREYVSPTKFAKRYQIDILLKNDSIYSFRTNGNISTDWYNIESEAFIKSIVQDDENYKLMLGTWYHEKDSLARLLIEGKEFSFLYSGEDDNDKYEIIFKDQLAEYVDTSVVAKFMVLKNGEETYHFEILGLSDSTFSMMAFPSGKIHLYYKVKE